MKKYIFCILLFFVLFMPNVNATPASSLFVDDNLYKCVIDSYNRNNNTSLEYTYNLSSLELNAITKLDCSKYKNSIESLIGLNKISNLNSINLSENVFLGGSLNIKNTTTGTFKSNILLPNNLKITDKTYIIENPNIVKIENDVVIALSNGSTIVTMKGLLTGNEITEKYLVSVNNDSLKKSNNSLLASLYLSKGDFKFDNKKFDYTIILGESTSSIKINATVLDKNASFVEEYGPRTVKLNFGTNKVLIKVKAEDSSISTYTLNIIRSEGSDENVRLTNIELSVGKIDFDPDVYIYNFTVESIVNDIEVKGVAESTLSNVTVSDTKLKIGENKILITVTSESSNSKVYQLIVTREDYDSLDNYLQNINIKNYNLSFNRNTFNYNLTINNELALDITPMLENTLSSYKIEGNENLDNGSNIKIIVSDIEGSNRIYTINIIKNRINITYKELILLGEFLIIIILVLILIFKKTKNQINNKKYVNNSIKTNKVCRNCGSINDPRAHTCYVCGKQL